MKWSVFLLGGLAGAAAAAYVAKKRPGMFAWATSAASQALTDVSNKAIGKIVNGKLGQGSASGHMSPKGSSVSAGDSAGAWGQIEMILNQDPNAKAQVDEIKTEAKTH